MRSIVNLPLLAVVMLGAVMPLSASQMWSNDFEASRQRSEEEGKALFVEFTGSDWCTWCKKLSEEVFEQAGFEEAVKKDFVLVELDFPKDTSILSAETIAQNQELAKRFKVRGYPMIVLCDDAGIPFGVTGYQEGGMDLYLEHLRDLVAKKAERDELLKLAESKNGFEKADLLSRAIDKMDMKLNPELTAEFYGDLEEAILELDKERKTSLAIRVDTAAHLEAYSTQVKALQEKKKLDEINSLAGQMLKDPLMKGDALQRVYMIQGDAQIVLGEKEQGYETMEKAIAVDPDGRTGTFLKQFVMIRRENDLKAKD